MKNLIYKLNWLGILNSPFRLPQVSFYFGKIERGTPYFLPRKWVELTEEDRILKAQKNNAKLLKLIEDGVSNAEKIRLRTPEEFKGYQKVVPVKWKIDIISLGWKTKFDSYRHEYNPMISITGFNRQFCVYFGLGEPMTNMCYWEAWLYYKHETNKSLSKSERVKQCLEKNPICWGNDTKGYTDYYPLILKKKYLN